MINIPQDDNKKQGLYLSGNIPSEILSRTDLGSTEKLIYGIVSGLPEFRAGNDMLAKSLGISERQVSRSLGNLIRLNILESCRIGRTGRLIKLGTTNMSIDNNVYPKGQICLGKKTNMSTHITNTNNTSNNKLKKKEQPPVEVIFPDSLKSALESWNKWIAYRKEIKKPLKPMSQEQTLKKWAPLGPKVFVAAIDASISNGWQGLFEQKTQRQNGHVTMDDVADMARNFIGKS